MVLLMERAKLVVEGAGAVGVAALLTGAIEPAADGHDRASSSAAATSTPACSPRSRGCTRAEVGRRLVDLHADRRPPRRARAAARRWSRATRREPRQRRARARGRRPARARDRRPARRSRRAAPSTPTPCWRRSRRPATPPAACAADPRGRVAERRDVGAARCRRRRGSSTR